MAPTRFGCFGPFRNLDTRFPTFYTWPNLAAANSSILLSHVDAPDLVSFPSTCFLHGTRPLLLRTHLCYETPLKRASLWHDTGRFLRLLKELLGTYRKPSWPANSQPAIRLI